MMTKITGTLNRVLDDEVRLQVGPIEYQILVPEAVRRQVQLRARQEVTFHLTEYLEGNSGGNRFVPRRIGFLSELELEFFELVCTVDKIGVKKALKAMARPVKEIAEAIARQDSRWLSTLPGIGAQTADHIVTTLKRKVTPFTFAPNPDPAPEPAPDAVVDDKAKPAAKGKKKADAPPPEPLVTPADGRLIEDVYEALMGLGHNPLEARSRLDGLLTCGKTFRSIEEALTLIYSTKG